MFGVQQSPRGGYNSILPWACMVHRNLFINTVRAKQVPSKPGAAEDAFAAVPIAKVSQPDAGLAFGAKADAIALLGDIDKAVTMLPPKQQKCFRLFYYEGLPYDEIATKTGIPKTTCRVQVCGALKSLKAWATKQTLRPSEEVYDALIAADTGLFGDDVRKYAPRGFYTSKRQQTARYRAAKC